MNHELRTNDLLSKLIAKTYTGSVIVHNYLNNMIIKMFTFEISLFPWRIETGIKRSINFIEIEFDFKVSIDFRLGGVEFHMNYVCVFCLKIVLVISLYYFVIVP